MKPTFQNIAFIRVNDTGDGAGVGKGRTVAGVIFENFLLGRKKAIWVSVSNDLKYDAERDLEDIGALEIEVYHLNKVNRLTFGTKRLFSVMINRQIHFLSSVF